MWKRKRKRMAPLEFSALAFSPNFWLLLICWSCVFPHSPNILCWNFLSHRQVQSLVLWIPICSSPKLTNYCLFCFISLYINNFLNEPFENKLQKSWHFTPQDFGMHLQKIGTFFPTKLQYIVVKGRTSFFSFYVGQNPAFPYCVFLPWESPLLFTSNTSFLTLVVTGYGEVFTPHQAALCDTICMPCNLIQFWHAIWRQCHPIG